MCKGVANFAQAPPDEFDNGFNWFDAIEDVLAEDDAELVRAPGTTDAGVAVPPGVDLLDWFSKQLNSDIMVAPNGVVLPSAPPLRQPQGLQTLEPQGVGKQPLATETASPNHSSTTDSYCVQRQLESERQLTEGKAADGDDVVVQQLVKREDHQGRTCASSRYYLTDLSHEDKIERVKQKRRESAQRSRARKNAYMKDLELENVALRDQVTQLRSMISQLQAYMAIN
eukprot:gene8031-8227_t